MVFYLIFTALAIAVNTVPDIEQGVSLARAQCELIPAQTRQLVSDNQAAIDQLNAMGADVGDFQAQLDEVAQLSGFVSRGCAHVNTLIDEMLNLFFPAVLCVVAIIFAMFVNQMLCCVTGCCRSPPLTPETGIQMSGAADKSKGSSDVMQNV